jgi:hypothetical protein
LVRRNCAFYHSKSIRKIINTKEEARMSNRNKPEIGCVFMLLALCVFGLMIKKLFMGQ